MARAGGDGINAQHRVHIAWVLLGSGKFNKMLFLATFTCSLSAHAPCLDQLEKREIIRLITCAQERRTLLKHVDGGVWSPSSNAAPTYNAGQTVTVPPVPARIDDGVVISKV